MGYQFYFGGTSLLILVGVAMDTVAQIEAQLVMRNYEGFLGGGGRLRGEGPETIFDCQISIAICNSSLCDRPIGN